MPTAWRLGASGPGPASPGGTTAVHLGGPRPSPVTSSCSATLLLLTIDFPPIPSQLISHSSPGPQGLWLRGAAPSNICPRFPAGTPTGDLAQSHRRNGSAQKADPEAPLPPRDLKCPTKKLRSRRKHPFFQLDEAPHRGSCPGTRAVGTSVPTEPPNWAPLSSEQTEQLFPHVLVPASLVYHDLPKASFLLFRLFSSLSGRMPVRVLHRCLSFFRQTEHPCPPPSGAQFFHSSLFPLAISPVFSDFFNLFWPLTLLYSCDTYA